MIPTLQIGAVGQRRWSGCAGIGRAAHRFNGAAGKLRPTFMAGFGDAGSGAVGISAGYGIGSPTFTRATAAACKLSNGLWKLDVASGVARSHYLGADTTVGGYGGYLAEIAATQLVTPSAAVRDMTDAAWAKVSMTALKNATGIDGVANSASTITATGANATILLTLVATASSRTNSCFVRRKTGTGTCLLRQGTATLDITSLINTTTYTLAQLNDNELDVAYGLQVNTSGDELEVDCNQFEAGSFASTPIPSGGTRNADVLTYPFESNARATYGTAYAEVSSIPTAGTGTARHIIAFSPGVGSCLKNVGAGATTTININDGVNNFTKSGLSDMATGVRRRASAWGDATMSVTGDGSAVASGIFDDDMGGVAIAIGCGTGGANGWGGTIRKAIVHSIKTPDLFLQSLSA